MEYVYSEPLLETEGEPVAADMGRLWDGGWEEKVWGRMINRLKRGEGR